jgi:hypothetical protein
MKERFEQRSLSGPINVACKFENQPTRYWITEKAEVVQHIAKIVNRYAKENETLTLRQLHYQFVGHVPGYVNHDSAYKKLGDILDDLRYSGIVPWNSFEDRGRKPFLPYSVNNVEHALQDAVDTYRIDRQEGQEVHVELWTEKDALSAIFSKITSLYHVRLVINKGYTSSTAAYESYKRFVKKINKKNKVVVLYFGDHDPSGLDMVRDIRERIMFFLCNGEQFDLEKEAQQYFANNSSMTIFDLFDRYDKIHVAERIIKKLNKGEDPSDKDVDLYDQFKKRYFIEEHDLFEVRHIGLTKEQIEEFDLPENPTKMTDSRADGYVAQHGRKCWEVDAIDLVELRRILQTAIEETIDMKQFNKVHKREKKEVKELQQIVDSRKDQNN